MQKADSSKKYTEPWYVKNIVIFVFFIFLSISQFNPLASLIFIFLLYKKNKNTKKFIKYYSSLSEAISDKGNELNRLNHDIFNKKNNLDRLNENVSDKEKTMQRIIEEARNKAQQKLSDLEEECNQKINQIIELDDTILLQSVALYKPMYSFTNSEQYNRKLDAIRQEQKDMIREGTAVKASLTWTLNNNKSQGSKMIKDMKKLLLRAFNSECEHVIDKVKYSNIESSEKRIEKAADMINKLGIMLEVSISPQYYALKQAELRLAFEYAQMKQEEKEQQKELRVQERETAKLKKEIEEKRISIKKEQTHYQNALLSAKQQVSKTSDDQEKQSLLDKIEKLEEQLQDTQKALDDVNYREANNRAGYVYVISNIGSFGENIYKIGMTRRLNPMDRVDELGDASVPFKFDVHAMIFSNDAPKLEAALHRAFEDKKLNLVNSRREFFHVSLDEIEKVVKENFDGSVDFVRTAEAQQYRESIKLKEQQRNNEPYYQ